MSVEVRMQSWKRHQVQLETDKLCQSLRFHPKLHTSSFSTPSGLASILVERSEM